MKRNGEKLIKQRRKVNSLRNKVLPLSNIKVSLRVNNDGLKIGSVSKDL